MPKFTVTVAGQRYKVDAGDAQMAADAVSEMLSQQPSAQEPAAAQGVPVESGTMLATPMEGGGQPAPEIQGPPAPPEAMAQPGMPPAGFPMPPAMEQPQQMPSVNQAPPAESMNTVQRAFAGDASAIADVALGSAMAGQEQNLAAAALRGVAPTAAGVGVGALLGGLISRSPAGAGIGARIGPAVMEGANLLTAGINKIFDTSLTTPDEAVQYLLTQLGAPQAVTPQEQLVQAGARGAASAVGGVGLGKQLATSAAPMVAKAGQLLASGPKAQAIQSAVGGMAGETARQEGAGTAGQIGAGVVGSLLTGGAMAAGRAALRSAFPAVAPRTMQAISEAERAGIPVQTQDVFPPQGRAGQAMQRAGEVLPLGTTPQRIAQQKAVETSIKNTLDGFGVTSVDLGETARSSVLQRVFNSFRAKRKAELAKAQIERRSAMRSAEMTGLPIDLTNSEPALQSVMKTIDNEGLSDLLPIFRKFEKQITGGALGNLEIARKQIGQELKADTLANVRQRGEQLARQLYGPVNEDIGNAIEKYGTASDRTQWKVANKKITNLNRQLEINAIDAVLEKGGNTPENIKKLIFNAPESLQKVLYSNLTEKGKANLRTAIMQQAYEDASVAGKFSPVRFKKQIDNLADNLNVSFTTGQQNELRGLARAIELTERSQKFAPNAETGVQAIPGQVVSGLTKVGRTAAVGVLGAEAAMHPGAVALSAIVAGALGAGMGVATKIYNSEFVRKGLVKLANAPAGTKMEMAAYQNLTSALETALR